MRIRIILQSNESGNQEYMHFTDDFDTDVNDHLYPGCTLDADEEADIYVEDRDIRAALEADYTWKRQ